LETTTLIFAAPGGAFSPAAATQNAARPLRDAVERVLRGRPEKWVALALHLSRLQPPAPRPHHRRIARAVLDDAASRRDAQLFPLGIGDLVLLFPAADAGTGLAATLARLFAPDAPNPERLLSRWLLPDDANELFAFLEALPAIARAPSEPEPAAGLAAVAAVSDAVEASGVRELLERQTAVLLAQNGPARVVPLFREIRFSLPALEARAAAAGHVTADPFLFRHLIARLDGAMLAALTSDLQRDGTMLAWARGGWPMLHLNMTVEAVLSPALTEMEAAAERVGARIAVEIALLEACADMDLFLQARGRLDAAGFGLVLDDVSHHALTITKPAALRPDLLKLDWSRQILGAGDALDIALETFGPGKMILHRADSEEAVRWGLSRGIRRFQGRHVDAMLAAGRIEACAESSLCTLRQCVEREGAATMAGRSGCRNLLLLDAGMPSASVPA
jgi:hypothetical protein